MRSKQRLITPNSPLNIRGNNVNAFPMLVRCCKNSGSGVYSELTQAELKQVWVGGADQDVADTLARFQSRALLEGRELARDHYPIEEKELRAGRKELSLGLYPGDIPAP